MYNLYEILQAAQGGEATKNIARQFGLSADQTQKAIEALLPAFSLGLQRNAQNPQGLANTLGLTGQYTPFFDGPAAAASASAASQGANAVQVLFGSPEVSRQVAAHAAVLSGVSTEVLMRMMPVMGTMIMGGLFRAAMEQGLGQFIAQSQEFMKRAGLAPAAPTPPAPAPVPQPSSAVDAAAEMMGQMVTNSLKAMMALPTAMGVPGTGQSSMPAGKPAAGSKPAAGVPPAPPQARPAQPLIPPRPAVPPPPPALAPPVADQTAQPATEAPEAVPPTSPDPMPDAAQIGLDHFNKLFDTGRAVQEQHLAAMRSIFNTLSGSSGKTGGS